MISLLNDRYNLLCEDNKREEMYILIDMLDMNINTFIWLDKNTLMKELDRVLNNLSDKIISIKNIIHQIYSK